MKYKWHKKCHIAKGGLHGVICKQLMTRERSFKTQTVVISALLQAKSLLPASHFVPSVSLLCGWRSLTASVISTFSPFTQFQPASLASSRQTVKLLFPATLLSLSCHFQTGKKKNFHLSPAHFTGSAFGQPALSPIRPSQTSLASFANWEEVSPSADS